MNRLLFAAISALALISCTKTELNDCKIYLEKGSDLEHAQAVAYDDDGNIIDGTECEIIYID